MAEQCPSLKDFLNADNCQENIGGTSNVAFFFVKSDLAKPLVATGAVFATPEFKSGKGLYKFDLKDESQQIKGESQSNNKGFNLTYNAILERVDKSTSELARALNNLDIGIIVPDGQTGNTQIMYDQYRRVKAESGNISSDTGAAASDDRQTSLEFHLNGVNYPNLYVEDPTAGGWESLLASAVSSS